MITISIDTDSRGTDRAQCFVDSRFFAAQSRHGAIHAICRVLRAAGIPDQPWEVPGRISGSSIYWMADRYVAEDDTGIRTRRWKPPAFPRVKAQKGGAQPQGAIPAGGEAQDAPARAGPP